MRIDGRGSLETIQLRAAMALLEESSAILSDSACVHTHSRELETEWTHRTKLFNNALINLRKEVEQRGQTEKPGTAEADVRPD